MKVIAKLMMLCMTLQLCKSACSDGCLKCGEGSRCLICDLTNFYINQAGTCVKRSAENCHLMSNEGTCLRCDRGFFIDSSNNKCIALEEDSTIPNCEFYRSQNTCLQCDKRHYLADTGKCFPVEIYVPGCKVSDRNLCRVCDDDKVLHPSRERCVEKPDQDHCASYGYLQCSECQPGYLFNRSLFFNQEDLSLTNMQEMLKKLSRREVDVQNYQVSPCQKTTAENCLVYETFSKCKRCKEFYFLDENGLCERYPLPAIPFCKTYGNYNICLECVQGYLLSSPSQCNPVKNIDKCLIYDPSTSVNLCRQCQDGFYVQGNTCKERLATIENCATYHLNNDQCATCASGFYITDDKLKCLPVIENCATYAQSNSGTASLTCMTCNEKHFLNGNTCTLGTLSNCLVYQTADVCQVCENGYYWTTNENNVLVCKQHAVQENCATYSQQQGDTCVKCQNTHVLIIPTNKCEVVAEKIANCISYTSQTECSQCKDGFFIQANVCVVIPEIENCVRKLGSNTNCVQCKNGYLLRSGTCYDPLDYQVENCQNWEQSTSDESLICQRCKPKTIFTRAGQNFGHCVSTEEKNRIYSTQSIPNCLFYQVNQVDIANHTLRCAKCKEGFLPSELRESCLTSCPNSKLVLYYKAQDKILDYSVCSPQILPNCELMTYIMPNTGVTGQNFTCLKCKTDFIKIQDTTELSPYDPHNLLQFALGVEHFGFSCATRVHNYQTTGTDVPPENCETFKVGPLNTLECRRCKHGYTGIVDQNCPTNLVCNKPVEDCDVQAYFGGLFRTRLAKQLNLHSYLTCHQCYTRNRIPFVFIKKDLTPTPFQILYGDEALEDSQTKLGTIVKCEEPSALHFRIPQDRYSANFPKNCGAGLFLVDEDTDYRQFLTEGKWDETPIQCIHCKPGFRPVMEGEYITKCEPIEQCNRDIRFNRWFNGCAKCEYGHSWLVVPDNTSNNIYYDRCIRNQGNPHCLAFSAKEVNGVKCLLCENGYNLNLDGVCEKLRAPLCEADSTYFTQALSQVGTNETHNLLMFYFVPQSGCLSCKEGYFPFAVQNKDYPVCFYSPYEFLENFRPQTVRVPQCKYYQSELPLLQKYKCAQCESGFILDVFQNYCVPVTSYPRCLRVNLQEKKCHTCQASFVNVDGFCEKPTIKFCKEYEDNELYQKCKLCQDEYKLVENHCIPGHVINCKIYSDQNCSTCMPGYHLIAIRASQYCLKGEEDQNCLAPVFNSHNLSWKCNQCISDYVLTEEAAKLDKSRCLPLNLIEFCIEYDNLLLYINSTYKCLQCDSQHYLSKNKCLERKQTTANCQTFSQTEDFCVKCNDGYYLTNMKECHSFPTGIYGCQIYKNRSTCSQCGPDYYLQNNTCLPMPVEKKIQNCHLYSNSEQCLQCQRGFFLTENQCIPARAQNCATYKNINQCETCLPNHGFYKDYDTGVVSCIYISTQNCSRAKNEYPFDCVKCNRLYYLNEGKCFANETFIPHCQDYDTSDTCMKCDEEFILSADKKRCLEAEEFGLNPLDNCVNNMQTVSPHCQICEPGYQLYKGNCVLCREQTLSKGCMYCGGLEEDKENCLICYVGYYMDENGNCVENGQNPVVEEPQTEPEENQNETPTETPQEETPQDEGTEQVDQTDANNTNSTDTTNNADNNETTDTNDTTNTNDQTDTNNNTTTN